MKVADIDKQIEDLQKKKERMLKQREYQRNFQNKKKGENMKIFITNYENEDVLEEVYKGAKAITPISDRNIKSGIYEPEEADVEKIKNKIIDKYIPVIVIGAKNEIRFIEAEKLKKKLDYSDTISYINLSLDYLVQK